MAEKDNIALKWVGDKFEFKEGWGRVTWALPSFRHSSFLLALFTAREPKYLYRAFSFT